MFENKDAVTKKGNYRFKNINIKITKIIHKINKKKIAKIYALEIHTYIINFQTLNTFLSKKKTIKQYKCQIFQNKI